MFGFVAETLVTEQCLEKMKYVNFVKMKNKYIEDFIFVFLLFAFTWLGLILVS